MKMKKFVLILVVLFSFLNVSFSIVYEWNPDVSYYKAEIDKYWGQGAFKQVDLILNNWNQKLLSVYSPKIIFKKYDLILSKIQKILSKPLPEKVKILLIYVEFKINQFRELLDISLNNKESFLEKFKKTNKPLLTWNNTKTTKKKLSLSWYVLNYSSLKTSEILVPISWMAYGVLGFYIKPLYGDAVMKSIVFKNLYWNEADYNIKDLYFVSFTWEVLAKTKLVNGIAYFNFNNPINLLRNWNNTFYIFATLNPIFSENQTNKRLKFTLVNSINGFDTEIITKANWNPARFINSTFNANTYYFRKSKPILTSTYKYWRLRVWTNDIYEFNIASTGGSIVLKKLNFNVNIARAYVDTGDIIVYIDGIKYPYVKSYFDDEKWNTKLHLIFSNEWYYLSGKAKKFKIIAKFKRVYDNWYIYTQLKDISSNTSRVNGLYTGNFSILWSDNAVKGALSLNKYDYFTEAKLNFSKLRGWYLKKK